MSNTMRENNELKFDPLQSIVTEKPNIFKFCQSDGKQFNMNINGVLANVGDGFFFQGNFFLVKEISDIYVIVEMQITPMCDIPCGGR